MQTAFGGAFDQSEYHKRKLLPKAIPSAQQWQIARLRAIETGWPAKLGYKWAQWLR